MKNIKMLFDNLPKLPNGRIKWSQCVGLRVYFELDGKIDYLTIVDYEYNHAFTVYKDNAVVKTKTENLKYGRLEVCLGRRDSKLIGSRYNIGDIVNLKTGQAKILNFREKTGNGVLYECECSICSHRFPRTQSEMKQKYGCPCCNGKEILIGYNDLNTTHPHLTNLFVDSSIPYNVSRGNHSDVEVRCPHCGDTYFTKVYRLVEYGLCCKKCSDGISYCEKFFTSLFNQAGISFVSQFSKKDADWCDSYRYDFFLSEYSHIVETHGRQHYENTKREGVDSPEKQRENDKNKRELALKNNIKTYEEFDCRNTETKYLKEKIAKSSLSDIIDLDTIDWDECSRFAMSSLMRTACELWNESDLTTSEIALKLKVSNVTIVNYLKRGAKCGLCNYTTILGRERRDERSRQVGFSKKEEQLRKTCDLYNDGLASKDIAKLMNLNATTINNYLRTAGEMGIIEYIPGKNDARTQVANTPIYCETTKTYYRNASEVEEKLGFERKYIYIVCKGIKKSYHKHTFSFVSLEEYNRHTR